MLNKLQLKKVRVLTQSLSVVPVYHYLHPKHQLLVEPWARSRLTGQPFGSDAAALMPFDLATDKGGKAPLFNCASERLESRMALAKIPRIFMYSITEVPLTNPALQALFGALSEALGNIEPEPQLQQTPQSGLLIAVVAWHNGKAVGCGLLRQENAQQAEIKRMYSLQPGVGSAVLQYLEHYARQQGFQQMLAAARIINSKAVNFYLHKGFKKCAGYGKYRYSSQSICLEKSLLVVS